jgi:hypothetical protein
MVRQWVIVFGPFPDVIRWVMVGPCVDDSLRSSLFVGDELGRVALKDLQGSQPTLTKAIHNRRVTGLAFSTHR